MIKESKVLSGLEREGPHLWVKRPWTRANYWEDWMKEDSVAPYGSSARIDEVFVNEEPLQWVPSRAELKPGSFVWRGAPQGGELVIYPPVGIADLSRALVEIPILSNVLGAWEGDPEDWRRCRTCAGPNPSTSGPGASGRSSSQHM